MRVAALDFGTNTFLLLIAEVDFPAGGGLGKINQVLHDEAQVVRLGQGVQATRRLHPEALSRADGCLNGFAQIIDLYKPERILACATSAARDVSNGDELLAIATKHGIPVQIISGEREADLTFAGSVPEDLVGPLIIIDVGGGSTEYIIGDKSGLQSRTSLDIGSVRLTEKMVTAQPIQNSEWDKVRSFIDDQLATLKLPELSKRPRFIAVAGTPTTLATMDQKIDFDPSRVHGYRLSQQTIGEWADKLASMRIEDRQKLPGLDPKRADVIPVGTLILYRSCKALALPEMEVSIRGLRYGIARSMMQLQSGHSMENS